MCSEVLNSISRNYCPQEKGCDLFVKGVVLEKTAQ